MRKIEVLVAVEPEPLVRLIEHLLDRPEFRIVKSMTEWPAMAREASRLKPELILTNVRLLGDGPAKILEDVKLASPASKLIVISFPHDLSRQARRWGADGYLKEEQLVSRLVPLARRLAGLAHRNPAARPRSETPPAPRPSRAASSPFGGRLDDVRTYKRALSASEVLSLATISAPSPTTRPTITTTFLPNGSLNLAYGAALAATGGATLYSWSIASGSLPPGLSLASTGMISGVPSATGTSSFTVQVTDSASLMATQALSITIRRKR